MHINKIVNESGNIMLDLTEIRGIIREYHEQLYFNKLDHLDGMDKFLETHKYKN